jgi:hypothetical protein
MNTTEVVNAAGPSKSSVPLCKSSVQVCGARITGGAGLRDCQRFSAVWGIGGARSRGASGRTERCGVRSRSGRVARMAGCRWGMWPCGVAHHTTKTRAPPGSRQGANTTHTHPSNQPKSFLLPYTTVVCYRPLQAFLWSVGCLLCFLPTVFDLTSWCKPTYPRPTTSASEQLPRSTIHPPDRPISATIS